MIPKLVAYYLPQFHEIPENNEWWGIGFTEWTNLKRAVPLYEGHYQPDLPLNANFYNLLDKEAVLWQTHIAKAHRVDAFNYYHYWFNGRQLLEKPAENFLKWKDIDHEFMFMWANHDWSRSWTGGRELLIKQEYGEKADWINHINYLLPYFEDLRYLKVDNKPAFEIYIGGNIPCLREMMDVWREKCIERGFSGLYLIAHLENGSVHYDREVFDAASFQEHSAALHYFYSRKGFLSRVTRRAKNGLKSAGFLGKSRPRLESYDDVVVNSIEFLQAVISNNIIPQVCTGWDNTPRYGRRGYVVENATPKKFETYLTNVLQLATGVKSEFVFLACWNEWCEGLVLEPTERYQYGYLEAVKAAYENQEFAS
jgi:hypothetical protein